MSEKLEYPPAFPQHSWQRIDKVEVGECVPGMNLRDYFAAAVLQGEMACQDEINIGYANEPKHYDAVAQKCYGMADAMLKARAA